MAKKSRKRQQGVDPTAQAHRGEPKRKEVKYRYRRNYFMGIGMILFTMAWVVVVTPLLSEVGTLATIGYVLLVVVSVINMFIVLGALRLVPWSLREIELTRKSVIFRMANRKERTVLKTITAMRFQKNPIFLFSRGLVLTGVDDNGKPVRESVFFGDIGKKQVYALTEDLKAFVESE